MMEKVFTGSCFFLLPFVALADGFVTESVEFSGVALPEGWSEEANALVSPVYSNSVTHIALTYGSAAVGETGALSVYSAGLKIADLNTCSIGASFDFPANSGFRSFRIVTNGVSLASFSATWPDPRLAAPTNVVASGNTGSSFGLSWDAVDGATGYKISVWTNVLIGAASGTCSWEESFANMESGKNSGLTTSRLAMADHGEDWDSVAFENGYLLDNGGGIRLGTSTATGSISIPHVVAAGETGLRVTAIRYSQDCGQSLGVWCVSDGGVTNWVGSFPVDVWGTYPISVENAATDVVSLPSAAAGGTLVLKTICAPGKVDGRIAITRIEFISGYSAGTVVRDVLHEESVSEDVLFASVSNLPPVVVKVGVQALAASVADASLLSKAVEVDLANPPRFAVPGDVVAQRDGYYETFNRFVNHTVSVWADGVTVPYWQCRRGSAEVAVLVSKSGMGNQKVGLYAYQGTNKNDTTNYSLAIVSKTNNKMYIGFAVTNNTEGTLSDFLLSYTARQWTFSKDRMAPQRLHFEYLVTNLVVPVSYDGAWVEVEELMFDAESSLETADSKGRADYATGSAFASLSATLEGITLKTGEVLMLRWTSDPVANGEALGVDNVSLRCGASATGTILQFVQNGGRQGG